MHQERMDVKEVVHLERMMPKRKAFGEELKMREKRTMANMKALRQDLKAKEAKEISV
jgi:hypothetical protein